MIQGYKQEAVIDTPS